jgi:hypothetical protein
VAKSLQATIAANQVSLEDVVTVLIAVDHGSLASPLRFVLDTDSIVSRNETYLPMIADVLLPDSVPGQEATAKLVLDHTDLTVYEAIAGLEGPLRVSMDVILRTFPDDPLRPMPELEAVNVRASATSLSGDLRAAAYASEMVPHLRFVPRDFFGMFRK